MESIKDQFSRIYDQYIEKIYRFVYLKVSSQETAEDITSKVFLRGWEAFKTANPPIEKPSAFLYQIARNSVVDHYRERGKVKMVSEDVLPTIADVTNLHEKAVLNSDIDAIKLAMSSLKEDYQNVLIWHYLEDMPIGEISQIIDKPEGTVRVMLHRSLKALKNELVQEA